MKAEDFKKEYYSNPQLEISYPEWLEQKLIKQSHPIDEKRIEELWNEHYISFTHMNVMDYNGFKEALKELSTQQPSEDHYIEVDASKELPPKSEDSDLSDVVFTIDEEDYKDYDSYDHKIKKWENPYVFKGYYDTPIK